MREAYSTLTRLPEPLRIPGPTASEALRRAGGTRIVTLPTHLHEAILDRLSRSLVVGGCAYDGLVALTAQEHGAQLVSLDRRAERTYRLPGVDDRILPTLAPPSAQPIEVGSQRGAIAVIGGQPAAVTRSPAASGGGFSLSAGPITVRTATPPTGFSAGGSSSVTMSGYAPESVVGTFLYSDPISLGTLSVGPDGVAQGRITIPTSVPAGPHTLQFTGWTPSGEPVILSAGITVKPQVRRVTASIRFDKGATALTKADRATTSRIVAESAALAAPVRTVVAYPKTGTKAEVRLAKARAKAVAKALRDRGMPGRIEVDAIGPARKPALAAGKVRITATG